MLKIVPITAVVVLAAGTCARSEPAATDSGTTTARQEGPQTGPVGEIENINEHLGDLERDVQKQTDDRARKIDEKIDKETQ